MRRAGPSVCVIGAGAIGLASALALARRGAGQVKVLECGHPGGGSSGRSAGIVETQYVDPLDIELRVRSMHAFGQLAREHGLELVRNGYLRLGHTPDAARAFARSVETQHDLGVLDACVLEPEQLRSLIPDLRVDDVVAGLFGPSDGYVDAHSYCSMLVALARREGAELLLARELLGSRLRAGGGLRLQTSAGELDCDVAVNAAGAWAGRVSRLLGHELELIPLRRQAAIVRLAGGLPYTMPCVMDYTPGGGEPGLYFRAQSPDGLLAGLHSEEVHEQPADPDAYEHAADEPFLERLTRKLENRLPSLDERAPAKHGSSRASAFELVRGWAGLYPASPTGRPLLGPVAPGAPVIVAGGAGGAGIQLAPVLGELVADWVLHGGPRVLPAAGVLVPGA